MSQKNYILFYYLYDSLYKRNCDILSSLLRSHNYDKTYHNYNNIDILFN